MRRLLADSYSWVALLSDRDEGHEAVQADSQSLVGASSVTTEAVVDRRVQRPATTPQLRHQVHLVATVVG